MRHRRPRGALRLFALTGLVTVAGCDVVVGDDSSDTVRSDSNAVSVFDLEPGMCVDGVREAEGRVGEFAVVECDDSHDGEVFSVFDIEGDDDADFPGGSAVDEEARTGCEDRFARYVGVPYQESRFQATFVGPSEETWADGDREVVCFAYVENGVLRRSIEGLGE